MAKIVAETELESEVEVENEVVEDQPKYLGGFGKVFKNVAEAKENPVVDQDGNTPIQTIRIKKKRKNEETGEMEETGEVDERETPVFKLFEVLNEKDEPIAYLYSRTNQTALAEHSELELNLWCRQFGAKRGRSKLFKPEADMIALANSLKPLGQAAIDAFLASFPQYRYVFTGEQMPETI